MALIIVTWDLPSTKTQTEQYVASVPDNLKKILAAPGIVEWRAYRNPAATTPQVIALQEYDSLESARRWIDSAEYREILLNLRENGCSNIAMTIWDKSPLAPEPLRP